MRVTTRKNTKNKVSYPIATAKTIKKLLISETLAIVTYSFFLLYDIRYIRPANPLPNFLLL
jgi:hypothetical protein